MLIGQPGERLADSTEIGWTPLRTRVVGLCFLLNMLDGADLLIMSFVAPYVSKLWSVSPQRLGILFSASLAGMAIGCLLVAPLADRFGRRTMILAALGVAAVGMMLSAYATSVNELMLARLAVGVGVGTIGVSMTAMAAEFAPPRHASFAVGLVQAGWPFAAIMTAFAAVSLVASSGWQSLMFGIGALSLLLWLLIFIAMPESPAFLESRASPKALQRASVLRLRLGGGSAARPAVSEPEQAFNPAVLFAGAQRIPSIRLWVAVTLGYFVLYFVISWVPKLAVQAGLSIENAIYAGASYNLGAFVGTAAIGALAIRFDLIRVVTLFLGAAVVALLFFGSVAMPVAATLFVAMLVGISVQGGFNGFWAIAAALYPAAIRGMGVGWALGVGRIGAVLGPIAGGVLVGAGASVPLIFLVFAIPMGLAALITNGIKPPRTSEQRPNLGQS